MKLLIGLLATCALAQTTNPTVAVAVTPSVVRPGSTTTATVSASGTVGGPFAAVQFDVTPAVGFVATVASVAPGAAATAANKTLACTTAAWTVANPGRCVVYGLNQTTIGDGALVSFAGTLTATASLTLSNVIAATASGHGQPITVGPAVTVTLTTPCDINGDGKVDVTDLVAYLNSYVLVAASANASCDLNGDGACNAVDLQRVANAGVSGGACVTGP